MSSPFHYRDYQEAAVQKGVQFFEARSEKNKIEVIPTGGGKSIVIGGIASNIKGKTLVLQPTKEILEQNYKKAQKFLTGSGFSFGDYDIGVYSASFGMKQVRKITFATIGSIINKKEIFSEFDNIIQDECDTTNPKGGQYAELFDHLGKPILGLTATPYRLHPPTTFNNSVIKFLHRTRPRIFSELLHVTQNRELFDRGYLSPIRYHREEAREDLLSHNSTGAEFTESSIKRHGQEIDLTGKIVHYIKEVTAPAILIFVNFVEEAVNVHKRLLAAGIESMIVTGEGPPQERAQILSDFTAGRQRIVINVGVLTVGFDFPALSCIINARITNSLRLYYQILGRGIRIAQGKAYCDYIDLGGNITRFGRVEDFEIVGPPGMERLKCGDRFLTGVDLKNGRDIEAERTAQAVRPRASHGEPSFNFGAHRDVKISEVPASYLCWIVEKFSPGVVRKMAEDEFARRSATKTQEATHG